jgi:hypothetical protein
MADIGDFARHAADQFLASQDGIDERFNLHLPQRVVEEFVKAVYYASLIPDEGRWPSVCLMSYRKGCERDFHFLFQPARVLSAPEIAKLAHAVEGGSHLCCICDNGRITIGGVHVTLLNERRELGYLSPRAANPLKLAIRRPGHIEVATVKGALVYKAGVISEAALLQHSHVLGCLAGAVAQEFTDLTRGTVESLDRIFNDLATAMMRIGHGGILLVAKEPKKRQFSSLREFDCNLLRELLVRYWDNVADLVAEAGGVENLLARNPGQPGYRNSLIVASSTAMLERCIDSIAHFAGVDGAIVMTYSGRVGAFNAIIKRATNEPDSFAFVDRNGHALERNAVLRNRGSRHEAALYYVSCVPDSFAFVISQDGSVSAFHNPGDGTVVCETGMRVLD